MSAFDPLRTLDRQLSVAIVAVVVCSWLYIALGEPQKLEVGIANGVYSNECCGALLLKDGTMTFRKGHSSYFVGVDKGGAYILSEKNVMVMPTYGLQVASGPNRMLMRLDDETHPKSVEIYGTDGLLYSFTR